MPAEKIATNAVDNGPDDRHTAVLRVAWGKPGAVPEAPAGWVNAGFTLVSVDEMAPTGEVVSHGVWLDLSELEHLERVIRRTLRQRRRAHERKRLASTSS